MADKRAIANDLLEFSGGKRLFSIPDLMRYTGQGRDWVRSLVNGLEGVGKGTSKRHYYTDIASRLAGHNMTLLQRRKTS